MEVSFMEPNQNHKINSRSVVQQTMDYITDSIIRKELLPGDQIPTEAQLTEILGVSRNTVRRHAPGDPPCLR